MKRTPVFSQLKTAFVLVVCSIAAASWIYLSQPVVEVTTSEALDGAISSVETDEKKVALTFNVGWGDTNPEAILNVLTENNVEESTFFLSGAWAERHPDLVEALAEASYEIGNHGYQYKPYLTWETDDMVADMRKSHNVLADLSDEEPRFFRPPAAEMNSNVLEASKQLNYPLIQWSIDGKDWMNPGVEQIVADIRGSLEPGGVLMFDASDGSKQLEKALPQILQELNEQNYEIVSIEELIHLADVEIEEL
ncbi:polysaccharide deacetylase family protein [Salsuginibacillus kocurii]|uniref:polysaccharide deacetylase family protein n=1 Tax=Salsuginibacillus kocurii TaxID=427078 RepID=UPI00036BD538|nr:polysaccharide deacetylase family protein [Salsuginibacillus kocurii]